VQAPAVEQAGADHALQDVRRQRHAADRRDHGEHAAPPRALQEQHDDRDIEHRLCEPPDLVVRHERDANPHAAVAMPERTLVGRDRDRDRAGRERAADHEDSTKQAQMIGAVSLEDATDPRDVADRESTEQPQQVRTAVRERPHHALRDLRERERGVAGAVNRRRGICVDAREAVRAEERVVHTRHPPRRPHRDRGGKARGRDDPQRTHRSAAQRQQGESDDRVPPRDVAPPQQRDVQRADREQHDEPPDVEPEHGFAARIGANQLHREAEAEHERQQRLRAALDDHRHEPLGGRVDGGRLVHVLRPDHRQPAQAVERVQVAEQHAEQRETSQHVEDEPAFARCGRFHPLHDTLPAIELLQRSPRS
jgi:hypothetical protein